MWFCEKSGSPVTIRSVAIQISGAAADEQRARMRSPPGRPGNSPQPVQPAQQPGLRAQQPGAAAAGPDRRAAARALGLEHAGPDDERQERDVEVAARGQEREVEARAEDRRRDQPDERRERRASRGGRAPAPAPGSSRASARPARGRRRGRAARAPSPKSDPQRVLGRRAVGVEARERAVAQLAAPEQRVDRVVVGVRRVDERRRAAPAQSRRTAAAASYRAARASAGRPPWRVGGRGEVRAAVSGAEDVLTVWGAAARVAPGPAAYWPRECRARLTASPHARPVTAPDPRRTLVCAHEAHHPDPLPQRGGDAARRRSPTSPARSRASTPSSG